MLDIVNVVEGVRGNKVNSVFFRVLKLVGYEFFSALRKYE